jgi:hypothetical protein
LCKGVVKVREPWRLLGEERIVAQRSEAGGLSRMPHGWSAVGEPGVVRDEVRWIMGRGQSTLELIMASLWTRGASRQ